MSEGKVGLVTGGASGIGRKTVLGLVKSGIRAVVVDISEENGQETVRTMRSLGGDATFCVSMFVTGQVSKPWRKRQSKHTDALTMQKTLRA